MYQNGLKNNQTTPSAGEGEQRLDSHTAGGTQNRAATLEEFEVSYKVKDRLSHDPAIPLLSIYSREMGINVHMENLYMNIYNR